VFQIEEIKSARETKETKVSSHPLMCVTQLSKKDRETRHRNTQKEGKKVIKEKEGFKGFKLNSNISMNGKYL
jgi:hypothetical protein